MLQSRLVLVGDPNGTRVPTPLSHHVTLFFFTSGHMPGETITGSELFITVCRINHQCRDLLNFLLR